MNAACSECSAIIYLYKALLLQLLRPFKNQTCNFKNFDTKVRRWRVLVNHVSQILTVKRGTSFDALMLLSLLQSKANADEATTSDQWLSPMMIGSCRVRMKSTNKISRISCELTKNINANRVNHNTRPTDRRRQPYASKYTLQWRLFNLFFSHYSL